MAGTSVSFDSNSLQTTWINTSQIRHENMPTKIAIPYIVAHSNGSAIPFSEYSSKVVTLVSTITGTSISDTDSKIDTFKGYFAAELKNLDIDYAGTTRRYIATCTDIQVDRPDGLTHATITTTLLCLFAFGQNVAPTTAVNATARTSATYSDAVTIIGSAPQQLPVATITLVSFTGTGSRTMSFGNNNNGQQLTVTRSSWTAGDVVQIDCVNKVVAVNGLVVDYTGAFIELPPGAQVIGYSDSFTARSINYDVSYYARYL